MGYARNSTLSQSYNAIFISTIEFLSPLTVWRVNTIYKFAIGQKKTHTLTNTVCNISFWVNDNNHFGWMIWLENQLYFQFRLLVPVNILLLVFFSFYSLSREIFIHWIEYLCEQNIVALNGDCVGWTGPNLQIIYWISINLPLNNCLQNVFISDAATVEKSIPIHKCNKIFVWQQMSAVHQTTNERASEKKTPNLNIEKSNVYFDCNEIEYERVDLSWKCLCGQWTRVVHPFDDGLDFFFLFTIINMKTEVPLFALAFCLHWNTHIQTQSLSRNQTIKRRLKCENERRF